MVPVGKKMKVVILIGIIVIAFVWFDTDLNRGVSSNSYSETTTSDHDDNTEDVLSNNTFKCDGRTYCSQMTSCEEAKFFLKNCPNPKMDGNNDGVPCERQWCN